MASIEIRKVQTFEEREAVFNLRYRVYTLERGVPQKYADHERQRIEEPQDPPLGEGSLDAGLILGAFRQDELLGTLRLNRTEAFGEDYSRLLGLSHFGLTDEHKASVTTKLCLEPQHRGSRALLCLMLVVFEYALQAGSIISFADCNPPLYNLFLRLGCRQAMPNDVHPEYGLVHPTYLIMNDVDHFQAVRSPFLKFRDSMQPTYENVTYFQEVASAIKSNTKLSKGVGKMQPAALEDLGFDPSTMNGAQIVEFLDGRIERLLREIEESEVWQVVTNFDSNPELVQEVMKEIYLEVVMYQPDVIEATIATIAQMPRTMSVELFDEMLHHQVEEFDHGEMALRDYIALGGDEQFARNRRMSPSSFSIAAMWRMLCHMRDPFVYLGALYPFEGLTPIVSEKIKSILRTQGMTDDSLGFVEYHSTADLEHTRIVKELIAKIADEYPESRESICYGIEYFLAVYPLPAWSAALTRARSRLTMAVA